MGFTMKNRFLLIVLLITALSTFQINAQSAANTELALSLKSNTQAQSGVSFDGKSSVIVEFNTAQKSNLLNLADNNAMSAVKSARSLFEFSISSKAKQSISDSFDYYPGVVMSADTEMLEELRANPTVSGIYPNAVHYATLAESKKLVHKNFKRSKVDGSGWAVVVLDTGVDSSHSFLNDGGRRKVVSEACYSGGDISILEYRDFAQTTLEDPPRLIQDYIAVVTMGAIMARTWLELPRVVVLIQVVSRVVILLPCKFLLVYET